MFDGEFLSRHNESYQLRFMKEIPLYSGCFVCGQENDSGLNAQFFWDGGKAVCDITPDNKFAGYKGIIHGGIVATLLDEVMIKALLAERILSVTAEITIRFKKPVYVGDKLHFEGWKTGEAGAVYHTEGCGINQKGEVIAEATARYIQPKSGLSDKLTESRG